MQKKQRKIKILTKGVQNADNRLEEKYEEENHKVERAVVPKKEKRIIKICSDIVIEGAFK